MWINQAKTVALAQILTHQVAQQCRFSGPCLAQDVYMLKPVGEANAKWFVATPTEGGADHGDAV
jgi:hypothetical protein